MLIVGAKTRMRKSCHRTHLQDVWLVDVPPLIAERFPFGGQDMLAACVRPESPGFLIRVELRFPTPGSYWPRDSARLWVAEGSRRGTLRIPTLLPFEAIDLPDPVEGILSIHTDKDETRYLEEGARFLYLAWECLSHEAAEQVDG
jgi:hypothetical protein